MKLRNYIYILSLTLLVSCKKPVITFSESQPEGRKQLKMLPKKLLGQYFCVNDSALLIIDKTTIKKVFTIRDTVPNQFYVDTLFAFCNGDVLKKYKGFYFLNRSTKPDNWEVKKLKVRNGMLAIGSITSEQEVKNMEQITETIRDTATQYRVKPTKKQLNQFIKVNGFGDEGIYVRR